MSALTREQLVTELAEVETQISEMVGAPDFTAENLSVQETTLLNQLRERRLELETRIAAVDAGGNSGDNGIVVNPTAAGW